LRGWENLNSRGLPSNFGFHGQVGNTKALFYTNPRIFILPLQWLNQIFIFKTDYFPYFYITKTLIVLLFSFVTMGAGFKLHQIVYKITALIRYDPRFNSFIWNSWINVCLKNKMWNYDYINCPTLSAILIVCCHDGEILHYLFRDRVMLIYWQTW